MPTRDELIAVLAKDWRDSGYDLDFQRTADAVLALFAAQIAELTAEKERLRYIIVTGFDTAAGVAVPEPDEQRCPHGETEAHSWPKPLGRAYCPGPDKRCADCLGSGQTMEHFGAGGWADMREVDCETCDGTGHVPGPAASPVAQEDQP